MTTGKAQDQNLEKQIERQMGCMAGFLQLFDRHQILTGKRLYSTKRLPPTKSQVADAAQLSEKSSPAVSTELGKPQSVKVPVATPSPERSKQFSTLELRSPDVLPPKSPLPLPFELKEGTRASWKFSKEAPRLSLDSRATVDAKGSLHPREIRTNASILTASRCDNAGDGAVGDGDDKQRRSTSVIARLMGLEPLPDSDSEPVKKAELRRSASESRVSRDLFQYRFMDNNNCQLKQQPNQSHSNFPQNDNEYRNPHPNIRPVDAMGLYSFRNVNAKSEKPKALNKGFSSKSLQHRRSFFDTADVFPEPKQTMSAYGDIEKRVRVRGIDEPSQDLETLKQILEALQLKGLLHSKRSSEQRNIVYDRCFPSDDSPTVVMKSSKSPVNRRLGSDSPPSRSGVRRNLNHTGENLPSMSPLRERPVIDRNVRSPTRARNSSSPTRNDGGNPRRSNNSIVKPKPLSVQTQRQGNESMENRRVSPVLSPKLSSRRMGSPPNQSVTNRSPRNRRSLKAAESYQKEKITTLVTEDESSSISESTISTPSQTDTERSKMEEYKEGKSLLERCDKLLHSIAEMTAANANNMLPSPVSVLDSSFYKEDDSSSPSPVMKRSIDFKDHSGEFEDEAWSSMVMSVPSKVEEVSDDCDFVYISEILSAHHYLPEDSDIFWLLEKQQYLKGKDTSKASTLQRKLIFDIVTEILERNRQLSPWKSFSWTNHSAIAKPSIQNIWSEFRKIRERDPADDLFEIICGVLKKDLAGDAINGWGDFPVELSEAVLDLERLIFKDLIGETIRDLATFACKSTTPVAPSRKLVF